MSDTITLPTFDDVRAAATRIAPYAHRTPVMTCGTLDDLVGARLWFKCENLQKVGAFKFRGACNAVMRLDDASARRGVATHSSGNHAQALALAARLRGIPAHIVMPRTAPPNKRAAVAGYGGRIVICDPTLEARESTAEAVRAEHDAVMIPPYDHPDIIAGQGTCAVELIEEIADLDAIIAPIGGGGLMSGVCIAAKALRPSMRIIGAEPSAADDAARSLAAGTLIPSSNPKTICDGLLTSLGRLTWPIIRDHVERIITVDDDAVRRAMRLVWERMNIIIEPSSATVLAAALSDEFRSLDGLERIGLVLSGGNVDLDAIAWS